MDLSIPGRLKIMELIFFFNFFFPYSLRYLKYRLGENYVLSAKLQIYPPLQDQKMDCNFFKYFSHIFTSVSRSCTEENNIVRLDPRSLPPCAAYSGIVGTFYQRLCSSVLMNSVRGGRVFRTKILKQSVLVGVVKNTYTRRQGTRREREP